MLPSSSWGIVAVHVFILLCGMASAVFGQPYEPFQSNITGLLNMPQLTLGYNGFLGLLPHEQAGTYMRRPSEY